MYALSSPGQEIKASTVGTSKDSKFVVWGPKAQNMWGRVFKRIGGRGVQVLSMETQFFQTSVISSSFKAVDSMEAYTDLLQFCGDEGGWQGAVGTSGAFNHWSTVVSTIRKRGELHCRV